MDLRNGGQQSSANLAAKSGRSGGNTSHGRGGEGNNGGGHGGRGGFGRGGSDRGHGSFQQGVFCQLCGKEEHTVVCCFKRFDTSFTGPP
jgi:hypothetical protein